MAIIEEYADVSLVDRVTRQRKYYLDDGSAEVQNRHDDIPGELMNQIEPFQGDGNAHLTVSASLSSSHEFHKAESFVSVSVTCNNNLEDIRQVHEIVRPFVQELAYTDHEEVSLLRDKILPPRLRKHETPEELSSDASRVKVLPPPQRSASVKIKTGSPLKPNFGR